MRARAAALALIFATPVAAQDRMTVHLCEDTMAALVGLSGDAAIEASVQLDDEGWCRVAGAILDVDAGTKLAIETIRWRGADMARLVNDGLPPRAFEITIDGIRIHPQTGDPIYDYLLALQMRAGPGMAVAANLRWDGLQDAVLLEEASFTFDDTNRIEMSGRVDGVDLTDMASIQTSMGTAGLRDLSLKVEFDGWFESYLALVLGTALLQDDGTPPAVQVEALKGQGIEMITSLPDGVLPAPSRAALSAFITDLPLPRGTAQMQISAEPTIGMARAMALGALSESLTPTEAVAAAMEGVTLLFTWSPARETQ